MRPDATSGTRRGQWHWEVPRGFGMAGEEPETTARRELAEELGAEVVQIEHLGAFRVDLGSSGDLPQIYWATITEPTALESEEGIDKALAAAPAELDRMINTGELDDAFTLVSIAYARIRGLLA
ncbi:MAG: NUDIX hydrolase [Streptosporangiaceae bacterium]